MPENLPRFDGQVRLKLLLLGSPVAGRRGAGTQHAAGSVGHGCRMRRPRRLAVQLLVFCCAFFAANRAKHMPRCARSSPHPLATRHAHLAIEQRGTLACGPPSLQNPLASPAAARLTPPAHLPPLFRSP